MFGLTLLQLKWAVISTLWAESRWINLRLLRTTVWIVSGSNSYNYSMLKLNNLLLIISFFLLILSFTKRNEFSPKLQPKPELQQEPIQTPTTQAPFTTTYNGDPFEIMPKYDYELYGLVVSYRLHDSESGMMLHA